MPEMSIVINLDSPDLGKICYTFNKETQSMNADLLAVGVDENIVEFQSHISKFDNCTSIKSLLQLLGCNVLNTDLSVQASKNFVTMIYQVELNISKLSLPLLLL